MKVPERRAASPRPVVAFDLMDTLVRDPFREALEAATGLPARELMRIRDPEAYPALERGEITEAAYWGVYYDAGISVQPDVFHAVRREGYAWMPGMREVLAELDGRAHRVVASNYPVWIEEVAAEWLDGLVEEVHGSCHLGVRKPDSRFYERLAAALGVRPADVLFVDDRHDNVEAARDVGMAATQFEDAAGVRRALAAWDRLS